MAKKPSNPGSGRAVVRQSDAPGRAAGDRARAHADLRGGELRVVNGRIVGPTLNDPAAKKELSAFKSELRKDPAKLREWYVKNGLLTPTGKLKKSYGG